MPTAEGPWSWLRMMEQGRIEPTAQGERFKLKLDLQGRKAGFELTAGSVLNPFQRGGVERFQCMDSL